MTMSMAMLPPLPKALLPLPSEPLSSLSPVHLLKICLIKDSYNSVKYPPKLYHYTFAIRIKQYLHENIVTII
jgi:hypothetical protein